MQFLNSLAELFKALGDPTRLKILLQFFSKEACVSEIAEKLIVSESSISHHLRILRLNNLINCRKEGKTRIYYFTEQQVQSIIKGGIEHIIQNNN
ncbi:transcriptional regulator [Clostridioides difficile]|nr:transcriptional regulator [Clostridioides difficile]